MSVSKTINLEQSGDYWVVSDSVDKEAHEQIIKIIWSDACFAFEDEAQKTLWTDIFNSLGYTLEFAE